MSDEFPRIFGRYVLEKRLSRGGMGDVFLAYPTGVGARCVIKTIRDDLEQDAQMIRRFKDEARTMVAVSHENIVRCFDCGKVDNAYYIAMEFVHGATLASVLDQGYRKRNRLPLEVTRYISDRLLSALAYLHGLKKEGRSMGLVHRDIAPENILIGYDGAIKLSDFGLARNRLLPSRTRGDFALGRLGYMPPEQARHDPIDGRADLYALGATMFEMFTGKRLVNDTDPDQDALWRRVVDPNHKPPRSIRPELPEAVDTLVMNAIAAKRDDRWQTAEAIVEFMEGLPFRRASRGDLIGHLRKLLPNTAFELPPLPSAPKPPESRAKTEIFVTSVEGALSVFGRKELPDGWTAFETSASDAAAHSEQPTTLVRSPMLDHHDTYGPVMEGSVPDGPSIQALVHEPIDGSPSAETDIAEASFTLPHHPKVVPLSSAAAFTQEPAVDPPQAAEDDPAEQNEKRRSSSASDILLIIVVVLLAVATNVWLFKYY